MPLSKPVRRATQHHRQVNCVGFLREDGLWDIEARMTDIKTHDVDSLERDYVAAGETFHDLSLRVTIDMTLLVREVEACIDSSPFKMCPNICVAFKRLEGTRIGGGWLRVCKERVGGVQGCTHLNELLPVIATTTLQSIWPHTGSEVKQAGIEKMLDTCHSWDRSSTMVEKHLPEFYRNPESTDRNSNG